MAQAAAVATSVPAVRTLQGADRVAALLLAMGKPAASRLLKHFDSAELKEIARAASNLGTIPASELEVAIKEFADQFAAGMSLLGTAQEIEKLLTGILPSEQISEVMSDVLNRKSITSTVWERSSEVQDAVLVEFVTKEHPQTAALILSKLRPASAARVIGRLPEAFRNNLMRRMTMMHPISASAMRLLESSMHDALLTVLGKTAGNDTNVRIADILNRMEHEIIDSVLSNIEEARPDTAKALKRLMFRFEDIAKLSAKARMTIFDEVPAEQVVLALRNTDAEFRELVLSSIASRARRIVEHELESSDEPEARAVSDARRAIAERVMQLIGKGAIDINVSENAQT
jgi:flagellar motor switch protein FliG